MGTLKSVALFAVACGLSLLACSSQAQTFWGQYGKDAQHDAMSTNGVQALNSILWQTPVDLFPVTNGSDVLAHYGSPLVTANTLVVNVRLGTVSDPNATFTAGSGFNTVAPSNTFPSSNDVYRVEGHDLGTGTTTWTEYTDYVDWMPHDWTPSYGSCIDSNGVVYSPGAGGTVWQYSNADNANGSFQRLCFYGIGNYTSDPSDFNSNVQICTPISVDSNNNIYFGFYVTSGWNNSVNLGSGIAKISSTGVGTWVTADNATGVSGDAVAYNCAPAISADGNYVYVAMKQQGGYGNPELVRLNTSDLSTNIAANLYHVPYAQNTSQDMNTSAFPYVLDDGTASPMIGPDGDVYLGVWWDDLASRGFMLHYSANLAMAKTPGAFGWDDTASVVPASAVPSYVGSSSYLILSKYNNYSDGGASPYPGDGQNEVAVLDPNASEQYTVQYDTGDGTGPTYTTMQEVLTVVGPTPNTGQDGVREWCINMAAIDVAGKAAIVNSEDGHCYRWDFTTNTLNQVQDLQPATGEAYTPTVVSADGISFAVNNAVLFAMWDGVKPTTVAANTMVAGNGEKGTVTLTANATGPGATIQLSSDNANVQVPANVVVPAGSSSATFNITSTFGTTSQTAHITATRYGFTATTTVSAVPAAITLTRVAPSPVQGGQASAFAVYINAPAPSGGVLVNLSASSNTYLTMPSTLTIPQGGTAANVTVHTLPVGFQEQVALSATYNSGTSTSVITLNPATLTGVKVAPASVQGGVTTAFAVYLNGSAGPTGDTISLSSSSADVTIAGTVTVGSGASAANVPVTTKPVSSSEQVTLSANFGSTTLSATLTLTPAVLSSIRVAPTSLTGGARGALAVYLNGAAGSSGNVVALNSSSAALTIAGSLTVPSGATDANVQFATSPANTSTQVTLSATFGSTTLHTTVTVTPPILISDKVAASSVIGGNPTTLTVSLNGYAASGGRAISLQSSSSSATVNSSVTVSPGASTASTTVHTAPVSSAQQVTLSATLGSTTVTTTLTVNPAGLSSVRLVPTSIKGGGTAAFAVYLNGVAGPGGTLVTLTSSSATASIPGTVLVPQGASAANVKVTTSAVGASTPVTLSATLGATTLQTTLTVTP
ncbi:MAG TPA: hypothetical protein VGL56_09020 [Fimbriimonadaceae bacterium]